MKTMPLLINLGKAITLIAWLMMAYNLAIPFEGKVAIILNILFAITCMMHCFQVAIFHMLFKTLLPLAKQDYLQVFIFGIFSLLAYRQRVMGANERQNEGQTS
ncbi:DUF1145 domain-containing protein [Shewanella sp.]|uniref:DUF1145 domain-containing protein n=1 Tax=Shewanella sp. TaxID=50422 RepID=UPI00261C26C5|nr:DUF1145 domain-containing protein [Shewanella sp.]